MTRLSHDGGWGVGVFAGIYAFLLDTMLPLAGRVVMAACIAVVSGIGYRAGVAIAGWIGGRISKRS